MNIILDDSILNLIEKKIKSRDERAVFDYVIELIQSDVENNNSQDYSDEEKEQVRSRLRSLGYID